MTIRPSNHHHYTSGPSGTSSDQWMRHLYAGQSQPSAGPEVEPQAVQALASPNPWRTLALTSAKTGADQLARVNRPDAPRSAWVQGAVVVGHLALGVAAFLGIAWGVRTIGQAIESSARGPASRPDGDKT